MIIYKRFNVENLTSALLSTIKVNSMVMWIIIGAACFTHYLAFIGVQEVVQEIMLNLGVSRWWILIFVQLLFFLLWNDSGTCRHNNPAGPHSSFPLSMPWGLIYYGLAFYL